MILSSPFYITQLLLVLVYLPLRKYYLNPIYLNAAEWQGYTRESMVITLFTLLITFRYKKFYSTEHFLSSFFLYAKTCVIVLILISREFEILAYYAVAIVFVWLVIKPEGYRGPSNILQINNEQFQQIIENKENINNNSYIFLILYADFAETCYYVG